MHDAAEGQLGLEEVICIFMILVALRPCCLLKHTCMYRHEPLQAAEGRNTLTLIQLSQQQVLPSLLADDDKKRQHSYECILDCWIVIHDDRDLSHIWKKPVMQQILVSQSVITGTRNCCICRSSCSPNHSPDDVLLIQPHLAICVEAPVVRLVCVSLHRCQVRSSEL